MKFINIRSPAIWLERLSPTQHTWAIFTSLFTFSPFLILKSIPPKIFIEINRNFSLVMKSSCLVLRLFLTGESGSSWILELITSWSRMTKGLLCFALLCFSFFSSLLEEGCKESWNTRFYIAQDDVNIEAAVSMSPTQSGNKVGRFALVEMTWSWAQYEFYFQIFFILLLLVVVVVVVVVRVFSSKRQ